MAKKRIIEISVNDEYILGSGVVIGAAGADESVILKATFNDTWVGLNIYATFRNSMGENPGAKLLLPSMEVLDESKSDQTITYNIEVPRSASEFDGKMSLVFSGFAVTEHFVYDTETDYHKLVYRDALINTTNAYFRVLPSDFSALDVKDEAEATELEQVLEEINNLGGRIAENENDITELSPKVAEIEANVGDKETEDTLMYDLYNNNGRVKKLDSKISALYGTSGKVTLATRDWSDDCTMTLTIAALRENDMIVFDPVSPSDRELLCDHEVFIYAIAEAGRVNVSARTKPSRPISLCYFIIKGGE